VWKTILSSFMTRPFYVRSSGDSIAEDFTDDLFIEVTFNFIIICTFFLISRKPKFKSETVKGSVFGFLHESCTNDSFFNFWSISSDDIENDFLPDFLYHVVVAKGSKINFEFGTFGVYFVFPLWFNTMSKHVNRIDLINVLLVILETKSQKKNVSLFQKISILLTVWNTYFYRHRGLRKPMSVESYSMLDGKWSYYRTMRPFSLTSPIRPCPHFFAISFRRTRYFPRWSIWVLCIIEVLFLRPCHQ